VKRESYDILVVTQEMPGWLECLAHDVWNHHPSDRAAMTFLRQFLALRPDRLSDSVALRLAHFDMMTQLEKHVAAASGKRGLGNVIESVKSIIELHRRAWEGERIVRERWEAAGMQAGRLAKGMSEDAPGYWLLRVALVSRDDYQGIPAIVRHWMIKQGGNDCSFYSASNARQLAKDTLSLVKMGHSLTRKEKRAKAKTPAKIAS
jgi:hypothetical protein